MTGDEGNEGVLERFDSGDEKAESVWANTGLDVSMVVERERLLFYGGGRNKEQRRRAEVERSDGIDSVRTWRSVSQNNAAVGSNRSKMRWPAGKARGRGRRRRVRVSVCERVRVPVNACGKERSRQATYAGGRSNEQGATKRKDDNNLINKNQPSDRRRELRFSIGKRRRGSVARVCISTTGPPQHHGTCFTCGRGANSRTPQSQAPETFTSNPPSRVRLRAGASRRG